MSGQCLRMPAWTAANRSGSEDGLSSSLRTWMCTSEAPASKASCVESICSAGVTGSAGLSFFRGTEPVMATAMTTGFMERFLCSALPNRALTAPARRFETSRCREIVDRQEGHRPDADDQRTLIDEELGAMVGGCLGGVLIAGRNAEVDEESRHGLRVNGEVF